MNAQGNISQWRNKLLVTNISSFALKPLTEVYPKNRSSVGSDPLKLHFKLAPR